jgi:catechol 2,3-dioxygenase-like lactoylglutathione lyase family enzyme
MLISHIDLRVSDRARAEAFYGPILERLGAAMRRNDVWTSFGRAGEADIHWFGFTEDPAAKTGATRVAFAAESAAAVDEVAALLPRLGARTIEGPDTSEDYYAVFFEDPDGNRLEVAFVER